LSSSTKYLILLEFIKEDVFYLIHI
jgi:hypothetical protein